ncbi:hypothetical protein BU25DRAFT_406032 [Macroventuria anomochaeta]|uniref:Uncharacterized protein n=1 Tax=Macroventuria anomochaeta TaxID=301207 RepID=A0ACB6SHD6_9PLEO|nr:uncharacterized protein BU25DRAFT_406032 [Macroventuria anomochaeta]KAF2632714.1 hypothetical protein BU25DRAFT_406032 [Macroventuria anomochaeta]
MQAACIAHYFEGALAAHVRRELPPHKLTGNAATTALRSCPHSHGKCMITTMASACVFCLPRLCHVSRANC